MKQCPLCGMKFDNTRLSKRWVAATHIGDFCYCCSRLQKFVHRKDEPGSIRADHRHYTIEGDLEYGLRTNRTFTTGSDFIQHAHIIDFFDGRTILSRNLVCNGAIPPWFYSQLPNNAFVTRIEESELESLGCGNLLVHSMETVFEDEPVVPIFKPKKVQLDLFS